MDKVFIKFEYPLHPDEPQRKQNWVQYNTYNYTIFNTRPKGPKGTKCPKWVQKTFRGHHYPLVITIGSKSSLIVQHNLYSWIIPLKIDLFVEFPWIPVGDNTALIPLMPFKKVFSLWSSMHTDHIRIQGKKDFQLPRAFPLLVGRVWLRVVRFPDPHYVDF